MKKTVSLSQAQIRDLLFAIDHVLASGGSDEVRAEWIETARALLPTWDDIKHLEQLPGEIERVYSVYGFAAVSVKVTALNEEEALQRGADASRVLATMANVEMDSVVRARQRDDPGFKVVDYSFGPISATSASAKAL